MAGFKQTILEHNPVLFLTFDGDSFDEGSRVLDTEPHEIIDESGYDNFGIMHSDHVPINSPYYGYRMGMQSVVDLEGFDQYAASFGFYGRQLNAVSQNTWPKAMIEVTHASQYNFYDSLNGKYGSFTVGFMFNKTTDETNFRYSGSPGQYANLQRTFVKKDGVCHIYYQDTYAGQDILYFVHPAGTLQVTVNNLLTFYNRNHLLVCTWDVQQVGVDSFVGTARMFMDARIVAEQSYAYTSGDPIPNTTQATSWEIMGKITAANVNLADDRHTSDCRFDQFFVLDKGMSADQVARLHKKTKLYPDIVRFSNPHSYWQLNDQDSLFNDVMTATIGSNGRYVGGVQKVVRYQDGPEQIVDSKSVRFVNGGCAIVETSLNSTYWNPNGDYTIGLWFSPQSTERGVILGIQSDSSPFNGMLLEWNKFGDGHQNNCLQFSTSETTRCHAPGIGSGWHYITLIRRGEDIEIWVDGTLRDSKITNLVSISDGPGQVYFMSQMPGDLSVSGFLSNVEFIGYALQPQEIRMRASFNKIYKINGHVYVQGTPFKATLRMMNHMTGELISQVDSSEADGSYSATLYDNTTLDVLALHKTNPNIRPRAYGPVQPAYHDDPA